MLSRAVRRVSERLSRGIHRRYPACNDHASVAPSTGEESREHDDNAARRIVWLDMEMTGLDAESCHILELACLITDEHLTMTSDPLTIVIHQPDSVLASMSDWCKVQHKKTGLIHDCRSSEITLKEAHAMTLRYLERHAPRGTCPLAGNSVHVDRTFLKKYMPLVDDYLHYRIIDVSTIKELARRWHPDVYKAAPMKGYDHRAALDIEDSLKELSYYRRHLFVTKETK